MFSTKRLAQVTLLLITALSGFAQADGLNLTQTLTIEAGPIWNQQDAERKCPDIAYSVNGKWTGQWWTTIQGKMSVCQVEVKKRKTAEERCFERVEGRVAWNQAGDISWKAKNIKRLCHNVDRPRKRIRCFKDGVASHNDWRRAITDCGGKPVPRARTAEERCFDKIQGKVAWNREGNVNWSKQGVKRVCRGTKNPTKRVECFKRSMNRHGDWQRAANRCNGTTPPPRARSNEEKCFDKIQGKVAWNNNGSTTWNAKNVRRVCRGTTNPSQRVACFKRGMNRHGDWQRAANRCNGTTPPPRARTNEEKCFDKIQGKVAWNRSGSTSWNPKNVQRVCRGTTNPTQRVACFKRGMNRHGDWQRAANRCNGTTPVPHARTPEEKCYDMIQGKVAWNRNGNTRWADTNVRRVCRGTNTPSQRVACFKRNMNRHGNWQRAADRCNRTTPPPRARTNEEKCFDRVQGKVAWNRAGNTKWADKNVKRLCRGTTNPANRVDCFKRGIAKHGKWERAVNRCNGTTPPPRTAEQRCFDKVQNKVAWNRAGTTKWTNSSVKDLCDGVVRVNRRISCFSRGIDAHNEWRRATRDCKRDDTSYTRSNNTGISIGVDTGVSIGGGSSSSSGTYNADVEAGPIWSNSDAKGKCTNLATRVGGQWTGQWRTTVSGKMSVCQITFKN